MTEQAPTFANTGELLHHDLGCRCWPHVSEKDALDAIAAVGLAEYRSARLTPADAPSDLRAALTPLELAEFDERSADWNPVFRRRIRAALSGDRPSPAEAICTRCGWSEDNWRHDPARATDVTYHEFSGDRPSPEADPTCDNHPKGGLCVCRIHTSPFDCTTYRVASPATAPAEGLDVEDWAAIRNCVSACANDPREPERYVDWYNAVLAKIDARLAPDSAQEAKAIDLPNVSTTDDLPGSY